MEINLPFRLKEIYKYRNLKTENNRINLEKRKKKIYKNIKTIWNKDSYLLDFKNSPIKMKNIKKPLSIISNSNINKNIKSLSIDNSENNIHIKKDTKLSLPENNNYTENLKNKFPFPLNKSTTNKNKDEIRKKTNQLYKLINSDSKNKNVISRIQNNRTENEKAHSINLPEVKKNNMSPNSFLDAHNFFINLNICLENFINKYNKVPVAEFLKKQKKMYFNPAVKSNLKISKNSPKIEKIGKNISYKENGSYSLQEMLHIEPIKTNINGNIHEYNVSYEKNFIITNSKFNKTIKEEESPKKQKNIILPNLTKQDIQHSDQKTNNIYRKTFNIISDNTRIIKTDNNVSGFINYKINTNHLNSKINKNLHTVSSNPNFTKSQSQLSPEKTKEEKAIKKYKIEANNKIKSLLYEIPPPNFYSKDFFYYNIFPNNCGWLIKKCFEHRTKWKECHSKNTNLFDFKWKDVINTKDFLDFGSSKKQLINHFEFHSCLSNKYKMFYNFAKFCEMNGIDVFKYVPFTISFDYLNYDELIEYQENFKEIFKNINNYIFENDSINNQLYDRKKIPYKRLFPLSDPKMGNKFYCEIAKSHYAGKNLWIVKAPNLNRGRCIKIFDNFNEIIKFLNEVKKGQVNQYDNIKEKGCKAECEEKNIKNENVSNLQKIEEKEEIKAEIKVEEKIKKVCQSKHNNNAKNNEETGKNIVKKEKGDYQSDIIIIQKYIEKPFLYNERKFDIRIWVLISHKMDVYIFKEGHLKASSVNYNINNNNSFIHLTNYSLQKYNKNFSKYETGNEISFDVFQQYLNSLGDKAFNFRENIIPKFKNIIELTAKSSKNLINQKNKNYCFEIFGYDFMMDEEKNIYLIEINTNPGLEISSEIIEILIPRMIDDALRLTVDELFETEYNKEWIGEDGNYKSKYHVDGYNDKENMWEYICNINKSNDKYICEDYYGFGYHKSISKKKRKKSKV